MAGESILLIEQSQAVQDIARSALDSAGYEVTTAANGAAALTFPALEEIHLVILGNDLEGIEGEETARILRGSDKTHKIPVLMLLPEHTIPERESLEQMGAFAFLLKPFNSQQLLKKVQHLFEQKQLDQIANDHLMRTADELMKTLASERITEAVERKTQLIIERSIQNVTNAVDRFARNEVDNRVSSLATEKEQELVKMTVHEVAQSMVEKLAVRKVEEAMESILNDQTERAVKRMTDQILPNLIRDRVRDMLGNILPREVDTKVQRAAEKLVPQVGEQIVHTVESVAHKSLPRLARDVMPSIAEAQVDKAISQRLPSRINELVSRELNEQLNKRIEPAIQSATGRIRRTVFIWGGVMTTAMVGAMAAFYFLLVRGG